MNFFKQEEKEKNMEERSEQKSSINFSELKYFYWSFIPIAIMVLVYFLNLIPSIELRGFGILPRTMRGLLGILFAPFLHGDFSHLAGNVMPLWVLLFVLAFFYGSMYWVVMPFLFLFSGIITWGLGSGGAVHIGASGLVFALASFIAVSGFLRRNIVLVVVAIFVAISYQFLGTGLIPLGENVSYASHYAGVISGVFASFLFIKIKSRAQKWKLRRQQKKNEI